MEQGTLTADSNELAGKGVTLAEGSLSRSPLEQAPFPLESCH